MASVVDLIKKIDSLSLDTANGVLQLYVVGMCGNQICIQVQGPRPLLNSGAVGHLIETVPGFPSRNLVFTKSDESASMAWFAVKRGGGK